MATGIELDPLTGGPILNERLETSVPGIFAAGNVVHVHDLVDNVTWEAEEAGSKAAEYTMGKVKTSEQKINLKAGKNIKYIVPESMSGERKVTLFMRVKEPDEKVNLRIGDIYEKSFRAVRPSEMLKVSLSLKELTKLKAGTKEVVVSCEREVR
jgi:succinate dehydrogenase/fumarate reductase flavoprotein subunit